MNRYYLLALLAACAAPAAAQSSFSALDSTQAGNGKTRLSDEDEPSVGRRPFRFVRYKWDVSVDASFLLPRFVQIHSYGYGYANYYNGSSYWGNGAFLNGYNQTGNFARFMGRKNEIVRNETNIPVRRGAYRLNVGFGVAQDFTKKDTVRLVNTPNEFIVGKSASYTSIAVEAGYEWQKQLSRFQLFYGYDAFARYYRNGNKATRYRLERDGSVDPVQKRESMDWAVTQVSVGVAPLVGVKYFVHPRFSLSLENKLFFSYNRSESKGNSLYYSNGNAIYESSIRGFSTNLVPLSALNATFHFGSIVR